MGQAWRDSIPEERKPAETSGIQRDIPCLSEARKPQFVDADLVRSCHDARQSIALCMQLSGYTDETLAGFLGLSKGYVSKCLHGRANFPPQKRRLLMEVCGNLAPLQYDAMQMGIELREDWRAKRRAELVKELETLKAA